MALRSHVERAIQAAERHTERMWTGHIQRDAVASGWPEEHAANLRLHARDGVFAVPHEGAEEWEYGDEDRPPIAVSRQFMHRVEHTADRTFEEALWRSLGGLL